MPKPDLADLTNAEKAAVLFYVVLLVLMTAFLAAALFAGPVV